MDHSVFLKCVVINHISLHTLSHLLLLMDFPLSFKTRFKYQPHVNGDVNTHVHRSFIHNSQKAEVAVVFNLSTCSVALR